MPVTGTPQPDSGGGATRPLHEKGDLMLTLQRHRIAGDPYDPPAGALRAVLVVLDGALEPQHGWQGPGQARLRDSVLTYLSACYRESLEIVLVSTMHEVCRDTFTEYLAAFNVRYDRLLMPTDPAGRPDSTRLALFDAHVRREYDVVVVLDSDARSVDMWRAMGLTCFQASPGPR